MCELRNQRDTSKLLISCGFGSEVRMRGCRQTMRTSEPPHQFAFLPCRADTGETVARPILSTLLHSVRSPVTYSTEHGPSLTRLFPNASRRDIMALSKTRLEDRLPREFPDRK